MLDDDMKRVVRAQRLGYVATVCPDGTPNLSPKGTTTVWDDRHLVFLDMHSPQTVENIEAGNAVVEINVVDPILRKGYRFKGPATVLRTGSLYDNVVRFYEEERGTDHSRINAVSWSTSSRPRRSSRPLTTTAPPRTRSPGVHSKCTGCAGPDSRVGTRRSATWDSDR